MKRTILVVDDEKYIREGLVAALEMDGYNVETVSVTFPRYIFINMFER